MLHSKKSTATKPSEISLNKEKIGDAPNAVNEAELRRLMYERIAQGNRLAEVEAIAHGKWQNR